ncbi:RusA family crossover junction endodeoxyribonuclease [Xanthomonas citri pv. citri]|uniref:Uncharacterized protein n=1 Tax=Xanthomonas axonopodis pv. citri (strain 306) TaxID=190486 RepID=A0AAI7ZIJ7_XANAC|nr:RusA family crossover junction endodeoxyribonuclease [Xanthomonas citri]AAM38783.1 hypothetical protein XAC3946 [Xanthomonas citri pv. citri str. 306]AJD70524.1 hypothetical protein J151_04125 [Xanthomonas citri subsp. citri A306]AJY92904.1 Endodeoxyribonuclease RusA [Xanthomonas citri pv. citri]AJZ10644.1 Endodeoxyribonuclease RusA [Xanthomonas citri pv. citri]AJZ32812.1 Endodeoxyribonuclease RusA [Xanthomonas citri pv. citri]
MVRVELVTENCDSSSIYKLEELASAEIKIRLEFDRIVSVQSQKSARDELCSNIRRSLQDFNWICAGQVNLELLWYLHATQRQETDKIGDIDNITKPIIDALTGEKGLLIDDSQIGSMHSFWNSRNHQTEKDVLILRIKFNNDECLKKESLTFIQYSSAVCLPMNVDFRSMRDILGALAVIMFRRGQRRLAAEFRRQGNDFDRALVNSTWEFHRTRLGGMDPARIYRLREFLVKCYEHGLTWRLLLSQSKSLRSSISASKREDGSTRPSGSGAVSGLIACGSDERDGKDPRCATARYCDACQEATG